jgi:ectoine hydroxylase-related dioxygenase (phytanoyl-CoA dioxygenase family)
MSRAVSMSIALTENLDSNGPLMIMRGVAQDVRLVSRRDPAGSATLFDCNCMHGSNSNITPFPRSNVFVVFVVFNSVENMLGEPFGAPTPVSARCALLLRLEKLEIAIVGKDHARPVRPLGREIADSLEIAGVLVVVGQHGDVSCRPRRDGGEPMRSL